MELNEKQQKEYDQHHLWLKTNELSGKKLDWGCRVLSGIDLSDADLRGANLHKVNLEDANLINTNFTHTYLYKANLEKANLTNTNFMHAYLHNVNFKKANLYNAIFEKANLINAIFEKADLKGVNFKKACLENVNFKGADIDFSCLELSCRTLKIKWDDKHRIQFLYHAIKPHPELVEDKDLKKLMKLKTFQKVVNKFHRVNECGKFEF